MQMAKKTDKGCREFRPEGSQEKKAKQLFLVWAQKGKKLTPSER